VLEIVISDDKKQQSVTHKLPSLGKITPEQIKEQLLVSGNWPFIKQRPYDIVANPNATPKAIFVSAVATAPLSAQYDVVLEGQQDAFQLGIDMLSKLSPNLHLSIGAKESSQIAQTKNCSIHRIKGPHPAGNVGVQIHHIDPISAGETAWVVGAEDVANIGRFFQTGVFDASRTLAVAGHPLTSPCYYKSTIGASLEPLLDDVGAENLATLRVINGDVLTGTATSANGYVGYYNNTISVLPEGNRYRMFGWLPFAGSNIHSMSNTSLSWLFP
jgi:Na+-transporting NADH:ubiquinone oxidoreductase subunit A